MSRKCELTGKKSIAARSISHAHNVTNRWQRPNVHKKRIYVPELGRWVRIKMSARALRTVNKKGLLAFLRAEGLNLKDVTC